MPCFLKVIALFLNYLQNISFIIQKHLNRIIVRAPINLCEYFVIFEVNVKKRGGGGGIDEFYGELKLKFKVNN